MGSTADNRVDDILAYKPFVDGLRAVSIIAVIAYHARLPGVTGGFVGVDIFFVISGYLIINQIVAGFQTGRFSFAGFWARRVLRILPPYLLVIAATLAIAPFVLVSPREFREHRHSPRQRRCTHPANQVVAARKPRSAEGADHAAGKQSGTHRQAAACDVGLQSCDGARDDAA